MLTLTGSADGLVREFAPLPADASGQSRLTRIRNRVKQWVGFQYDDSGCLRAVRTSEGRFIRFEHDARGKLKRVIVPVPTGDVDAGWYDKVSFTYSAEGDLIAATDSFGKSRTFEYDAHLLVAETDRDDNVFYFRYDGRDSTARCIRTWGDDRKGCDKLYYRKITYDLPNHRTFVEDSRKQTTIYEMNELGAVVKTTDPHGASTTRQFDEHLWLVAETDALGQRSSYAYDAVGNLTERVLPNGATWRTDYNADHQPVRSTDPVGVVSLFEYDPLSRLVQSTTSSGEATRVHWDSAWPARITRPDGTTMRFARDELGQILRILFQDGTEQHRQYDRQGRLTKIRDGAGRSRRAVFDLEGRIVVLEHPGGIRETFSHSAEGDVIEAARPGRQGTLSYSHNHQLACAKEAGECVSFQRDAEGELAAVVNEAGDDYRIVRDACGRVTEEITYEGRKRTFVRDALGRVIHEFSPSQAGSQFEYDALSNLTRVQYGDGAAETYAYDLVGRLVAASNEVGTVVLERDLRGRVVREAFGDAWVATERDSLGRTTGTRTSLGLTETIRRSEMGHVVAMSASGGWSARFERDEVGAEVRRQMPGGVDLRRSWDDAGRPAGLVMQHGPDVLAETTYTWSGLDVLLTNQNVVTGETEHYAHDARGRLAGSRDATRHATVWRSPSATGDLYKSPDRSDRRYGKGGLLRSDRDTTYAYDTNGNVAEKRLADGSSCTYRWNDAGRLVSVTTPEGTHVTFSYDALGRRVEKLVGVRATRWLWDGHVPVHEYSCGGDGEDNDFITWLFEPEHFTPVGKVVHRAGEAKAYSIISDFLGTPMEMVDEAGRIAWKAQLDVYGAVRADIGASKDCPWRWPGQYEDSETNLYYNRFRYYDPNRGDYIAQDPIRLLGGHALYRYVRDPTAYIDPFGLAPGGVDFANSPSLYPATDGQSSIVQIPLQGARGRDFTQANIEGGFPSTPSGYTWHHLDDFDPATGMSTMQLVERDAHAGVSHSGSVSQFEKEFGVKYDTAEARAIAEENGWQRDRRRKRNPCGT